VCPGESAFPRTPTPVAWTFRNGDSAAAPADARNAIAWASGVGAFICSWTKSVRKSSSAASASPKVAIAAPLMKDRGQGAEPLHRQRIEQFVHLAAAVGERVEADADLVEQRQVE